MDYTLLTLDNGKVRWSHARLHARRDTPPFGSRGQRSTRNANKRANLVWPRVDIGLALFHQEAHAVKIAVVNRLRQRSAPELAFGMQAGSHNEKYQRETSRYARRAKCRYSEDATRTGDGVCGLAPAETKNLRN